MLNNAKCTSCGANLKVDNTNEAANCEFCGAAFIVEKAINNYNITNTQITAGIVNIGSQTDFEIVAGKLLRYKGAATVVIIPNEVTYIDKNAFQGCAGLTSITIPSHINGIGIKITRDNGKRLLSDDSVLRACTNLSVVNWDKHNDYSDYFQLPTGCLLNGKRFDDLFSVDFAQNLYKDLAEKIEEYKKLNEDYDKLLEDPDDMDDIDWLNYDSDEYMKIQEDLFERSSSKNDPRHIVLDILSELRCVNSENEDAWFNEALITFEIFYSSSAKYDNYSKFGVYEIVSTSHQDGFMTLNPGNLMFGSKLIGEEIAKSISNDLQATKRHLTNTEYINRLDEVIEKIKNDKQAAEQALKKQHVRDVEGNKSRGENSPICYIATAVYGDCNAPQVLALRHFRDNTLSKSAAGQLFIKTYYRLSPPIAQRLKKMRRLNAAVRVVLDKFVAHLSHKN